MSHRPRVMRSIKDHGESDPSQLLKRAAGAIALPLGASLCRRGILSGARPVHIVLGFPPGGSSDVLARVMAQSLEQQLKQPFIVDNHPGAGSNIGAEMVTQKRHPTVTHPVVDIR